MRLSWRDTMPTNQGTLRDAGTWRDSWRQVENDATGFMRRTSRYRGFSWASTHGHVLRRYYRP